MSYLSLYSWVICLCFCDCVIKPIASGSSTLNEQQCWQIYYLCVRLRWRHPWASVVERIMIKWRERDESKTRGATISFFLFCFLSLDRRAHHNFSDWKRRWQQSALLNGWKPQGFPRQGVANPFASKHINNPAGWLTDSLDKAWKWGRETCGEGAISAHSKQGLLEELGMLSLRQG